MICRQNFSSPSLKKVTGRKRFLDLEHFRKKGKLSRRGEQRREGLAAAPPAAEHCAVPACRRDTHIHQVCEG